MCAFQGDDALCLNACVLRLSRYGTFPATSCATVCRSIRRSKRGTAMVHWSATSPCVQPIAAKSWPLPHVGTFVSGQDCSAHRLVRRKYAGQVSCPPGHHDRSGGGGRRDWRLYAVVAHCLYIALTTIECRILPHAWAKSICEMRRGLPHSVARSTRHRATGTMSPLRSALHPTLHAVLCVACASCICMCVLFGSVMS